MELNQFDPGSTFDQLLKFAQQEVTRGTKRAAVDAQTLTGGGAGAGDPMAAMGGGGGDPMAAMGGMGGGGGDPMAAMGGMGGMGGGSDPALEARLAALEQQLAAGGGAAAGGGVEPIKPKIDVNVVLLQLLKMVAKLCDASGVPISASEMVMTQDDLTNFGMQQDQAGGGGVTEGGAGGGSAISPIDPMQGASPELAKAGSEGEGYDGGRFTALSGKAAAMAAVMAQRKVA